MHGTVHDYIVLKTVKDGYSYQTGETHDRKTIRDVGILSLPELKTQPKFKNILDIGSLDLIGSQRGYNFMGTASYWLDLISDPDTKYTGIDIMPGNNVDIVMNAHDLTFKDNFFDLVLCMQMLEHDDDAPKTLAEAYRVLQPGGVFYLTCASAEHPEHADLGGGSRAYIFITTDDLVQWLAAAGFKSRSCEIGKIGSNFYVECKK